MATPAHCYYCFESLAASYQRKDPIDLASVEDLWERHEQFKKLSALQQNTEETDSLSVDDDDDDDEPRHRIQLPSVRRLQSDSSSTTRPSSLNSSHSTLTTSTTLTTPGSASLSDTVSGRSSHRREPREHQEYPLFVTWNTISRHGHKSLRGCIGTFEAQELSEGLRDYALTSAFEDTRFTPIPSTLLPSLSCSLTLLGNFEPCTNALDWILGLHGLRISFIHRGRRYGATYLPDVAVEQGWTKEETVKSLMQKAGWDDTSHIGSNSSAARRFFRGSAGSTSNSSNNNSSASPPGASSVQPPWERVSDFRAVKYQGLRASCTYAEWQEWRQWVLGLGDGSEKLLVG
ncbi:AMMECR1 domain-containing protein [Aspergillus saccharolyticus JOP 1030-1]|uniref:AMMECR1 domain-containing protein n=1 Tax=Aspergillus saccharolyticus JOP 1030-1 TaxID=1450539 RepID=A0A318ZEB3_9EURO|nr:hypothetical protein BP01DRAFT_394640 [Aspergillus saccharolyticus JOP 1030-1]PYH41910.1 hypothetical protein BP01DRAFT_394640 [Aspergillus saccharolyticus JOP 1030-1]